MYGYSGKILGSLQINPSALKLAIDDTGRYGDVDFPCSISFSDGIIPKRFVEQNPQPKVAEPTEFDLDRLCQQAMRRVSYATEANAAFNQKQMASEWRKLRKEADYRHHSLQHEFGERNLDYWYDQLVSEEAFKDVVKTAIYRAAESINHG